MTQPLPMTWGRRIALAIGAPLALAFFGWNAFTAIAYAGQGSYLVNLSIPVHGRTATLAVDSGDVRLRPGNPGWLTVTGTARYALFRSTNSSRQTAAGPVVASRCHQVTGPCSFDYTVTLPAGLAVRASDGSGDLSVQRLAGPLVLSTGSGNVTISSVSGDVQAASGSGDVTGSGLAGTQLMAADGSGNIALTGLASQIVTITNGSGDVTLIFREVPGTVRVNDQSGNVKLVMPPGSTAYHVTASTGSGQQTVRVPQDTASPHVSTVTDGSGNISITR